MAAIPKLESTTPSVSPPAQVMLPALTQNEMPAVASVGNLPAPVALSTGEAGAPFPNANWGLDAVGAAGMPVGPGGLVGGVSVAPIQSSAGKVRPIKWVIVFGCVTLGISGCLHFGGRSKISKQSDRRTT